MSAIPTFEARPGDSIPSRALLKGIAEEIVRFEKTHHSEDWVRFLELKLTELARASWDSAEVYCLTAPEGRRKGEQRGA